MTTAKDLVKTYKEQDIDFQCLYLKSNVDNPLRNTREIILSKWIQGVWKLVRGATQ